MMKNSKFTDILLLLFIILWSGGGFTYGLFPYWPVFLLPVSWMIFKNKNFSMSRREIYFLILVCLFIFLQQMVYHGGITNIVAAVCSLICLFFISRDLKVYFPNLIVKIVVFFAGVSLLFWMIDIFPSGHEFLLKISYTTSQLGMDSIRELRELHNFDYSRNLFFYSVNVDAIYLIPRNNGPFYEPGRFTVFLTVALAINLFKNNKPLFVRDNIILLIANVTTFSTTGYVAMAILFSGYIIRTYKISFKSIFLSAVLVVIAVYVSQLDFMSEKIVGQMQSDATSSRFGAALYHIPMILDSPILGYSDRLSYVYGEIDMSPNGWTALMLHWGIPISLLWIFLLFKGTKVYSDENAISRICIFMVILTLAFTQTIMTSPFYMVLYFMGLDSSKNQSINT